MQQLVIGEYAGSVAVTNTSNGILASITTYDPDQFNDTLHYHENAHFGFTIDGFCLEKKKEVYQVVPGKITYYHAGEPHQALRIIKPSLRINLEIENDFFERFRITEDMVRRAADKNPDAKFLMVKIYKELLINDALTDTTNEMTFLQLVHHTETLENNSKLPSWVRAVNDFIHDNMDNKITLDDLAIAANVHPITVSKHFPKYFHCTLGEYIRKLRVEKSLTLIKDEDMSLTNLAYACGFFDQSHFIKTFKYHTGFLPARYRSLA